MDNRWWIYQQERFPLLDHGPLIAVFSVSAVSFSSLLRAAGSFPGVKNLLVAFVSALLFFLQLRVADEFKDYDDDARFRPYRPVPRGLVTLSELKTIAIAAAAIQLILALCFDLAAIPLLLLVWLYLSLMIKEFFVCTWLKSRPFTYMWTHLLILPLITLYLSAFDWLGAGARPSPGLLWFLAVSFFNGMVIELARKMRAPEQEERGVETYSALWGLRTAVAVWLGALALTAASALMAAERVGMGVFLAALVIALWGAAAIGAWLFVRQPTASHAKVFPALSGIWTIALYASLAAPLWLVGRIF